MHIQSFSYLHICVTCPFKLPATLPDLGVLRIVQVCWFSLKWRGVRSQRPDPPLYRKNANAARDRQCSWLASGVVAFSPPLIHVSGHSRPSTPPLLLLPPLHPSTPTDR